MTWQYEWRCTECCPNQPCVLHSIFEPSRCVVSEDRQIGFTQGTWVRGALL